MKTQFLRAISEDKLILQGLLYKPEKSTNKLVVYVHGMSGNFYECKFVDSMAKVFTDNGWAFLAPNNRGHDFIADLPVAGEKEKYKRIGNMFEKFEECVLDIKPWIDFAEEQGFSEIVLLGHSLGCSKVVYYLVQTKDKRVNKLVLASPADMVGLALADKNYERLLDQSKKMVKEGKGVGILPEKIWDWYYLSANTYLDFSVKGNPIDVFNLYDKDKSSILGEIEIPIFAFFGDLDKSAVMGVAEGLKIIESKARKSPKVNTLVIRGASHVYFGHEDETAHAVLDWINKL
jgi:pimeloyl-ACP methyl ester carboxylesterase